MFVIYASYGIKTLLLKDKQDKLDKSNRARLLFYFVLSCMEKPSLWNYSMDENPQTATCTYRKFKSLQKIPTNPLICTWHTCLFLAHLLFNNVDKVFQNSF